MERHGPEPASRPAHESVPTAGGARPGPSGSLAEQGSRHRRPASRVEGGKDAVQGTKTLAAEVGEILLALALMFVFFVLGDVLVGV